MAKKIDTIENIIGNVEKLKAKNKEYSDSITNAKKTLETLQKQSNDISNAIQAQEKLKATNAITLKKFNSVIADNELDMKQTTNALILQKKELNAVNKEYDTIAMDIVKQREKADKAIEIKERTEKNRVAKVEKEISVLEDEKAKKETKNANLKLQNDEIVNTLRAERLTSSKLNDEITEKAKELKVVENDLAKANIKKEKTETLQAEQVKLEQTLEETKLLVKEKRREFMSIDEKKVVDTLNARKVEQDKRDADFKEKEYQFYIRKEEVEKIAKTIRKHSDRLKLGIKI